MRASVGSTEAVKDVVARFGVVGPTHARTKLAGRVFAIPVDRALAELVQVRALGERLISLLGRVDSPSGSGAVRELQ